MKKRLQKRGTCISKGVMLRSEMHHKTELSSDLKWLQFWAQIVSDLKVVSTELKVVSKELKVLSDLKKSQIWSNSFKSWVTSDLKCPTSISEVISDLSTLRSQQKLPNFYLTSILSHFSQYEHLGDVGWEPRSSGPPRESQKARTAGGTPFLECEEERRGSLKPVPVWTLTMTIVESNDYYLCNEVGQYLPV